MRSYYERIRLYTNNSILIIIYNVEALASLTNLNALPEK